MARVHTVLAAVLAILVAVLAWPRPAEAQNGACPPGSHQITAPGAPHGTWPDTMIACSYVDHLYGVDDPDDEYPCEQQVLLDMNDAWLTTWSFIFVPDTNQYYGQFVRLSFYFFTYMNTGEPIDLHDWRLRIRLYDHNDQLTTERLTRLGDHRRVTTWRNDSVLPWVRHYYDVWLVDLNIWQGDNADERGGYIRITPVAPEGESVLLWRALGLAIASFHFGSFYDTFPEHCAIPNASVPYTPVPATPTNPPPTWTPVPGATATPTPIVVPGTPAPGATRQPTLTPTPLVFPTIRSEITPTPWATVVLPTIAWPTPRPTVLLAMPGDPGDPGDGDGGIADALLGLASNVADDFDQPMDQLANLTDPGAWTASGAGDVGAMGPAATMLEVSSLVTLPVSYMLALGELMPNLAPWLTWFLSLAGLVFFQVVLKVTVQFAAFVFELIRRLWEAVPLN